MSRFGFGFSVKTWRRRAAIATVLGLAGSGFVALAMPASAAGTAVDDVYSTVGHAPTDVLSVLAPGVLANDGANISAGNAILISGQGTLNLAADGSFVFTPTGTYAGAVVFTYNATDGAAVVSTANITITVPNSAPTLSPASVAPISLASMVATTNFAVTVNDADVYDTTAPNSLSLVASGFTGTLGAGNVSVSGTSPNFTVTVSGVGSAVSGTFDLVGSDVVGATASMTVSVTIANAAPVITAPTNQVVGATNGSTGALAVTITDADTLPAGVTLTAVSSAPGTVTTTANSAARTVTVAGSASNPVGVVTVTVSANDGVNTPVSTTFTVTFNNAAPTIVAPLSQSLPTLLSSTGVLSVTVNDIDTPAGLVILTAASSSPGTVSAIADSPLRQVTVTGLGGNVAGVYTITLTANDGIAPPVSTTFSVSFANSTPIISTVLPQTATRTDVAIGPIPVNIADSDTMLSGIALSALSSNSLVAVTVDNSTNPKTISITDPTHKHASSTITLNATDGANNALPVTFVATFVNSVPTLTSTIPAQSLKINSSSASLAFTVSDLETLPASLVVTATSTIPGLIVPTVGGSGGSRTVTIANGLVAVNSTATITLKVDDLDGGIQTYPIVVTVADTAPVGANSSPILIDAVTKFLPLNLVAADPDLTPTLAITTTAPANGTVACTGTVCRYTPAGNFVGVDAFSYTVSDSILTSPSYTVTLNVGFLCTRLGTSGNDLNITALVGDVVCAIGGNDNISTSASPAVIIGGPGDDTVNFTATPGADNILATENQITINGVTTQLYSIEHIVIHGGAGDDLISVTQSSLTGGGVPVVDYTVTGDAGTLDQLRYVSSSGSVPAPSGGTLKVGGYTVLTYSSIEAATSQQGLFLGDTGGTVASNDSFTLQYTRPLGSVVDGLGLNDVYNVLPGQFAGPLAVSDSGVTGTDTVNFLGSSLSETWSLDGQKFVPDAGNFTTYTGIESVKVTTGAGNDSVNFSLANTGATKYFFDGGSGNDTLIIDAQGRVANVAAGSGGLSIVTAAGLSPIPVIRFESIKIINSASGIRTYSSQGYWMVASDGGVFSFGDHGFVGSTGAIQLNKPIVDMASSPSGDGYVLCAADGGIFAFGDAGYYGSTGNLRLNKPVVGCAATPSGKGYWLVASDGGIFAFGDAGYYGSTGNLTLNKLVVAMAATPTGRGYWMVASDGGIFAFGDAGFYGSTGNINLNKPVVGMTRTVTGNGYWLAASDGGIFAFGDAGFYGSTGNLSLNKPIVGMEHTINGSGYWLFASDGGVFSFGDAGYFGSTGAITLNRPMVHGRAKTL